MKKIYFSFYNIETVSLNCILLYSFDMALLFPWYTAVGYSARNSLERLSALHFGEANIWQMVENRAISNENEKQERNAQCFIYTANQCFDSKTFQSL